MKRKFVVVDQNAVSAEGHFKDVLVFGGSRGASSRT